MFKSLRLRMILIILSGTILSILLVSIITNVTLFNKFDKYMADEQENKIQQVVELLTNSYLIENQWNERVLDNIRTSPITRGFNIVLEDDKQNIVFEYYVDNSMIHHHSEMMRRMGHGMMGSNMMDDMTLTWKQREILIDGKKVGVVNVGYTGPFMISEREIEFTRGINSSIFYSAIISILVSVFLGIYSSKIVSNPVLRITKAANDIRRGNLDVKISTQHNIKEINELSESINHLAESLNEQEQLRKRLTSDISHELRTPLTILQSHIEAIIDGVWQPTKDKMKICKNEVDRLIKLVEELKKLTDIENNNIELHISKFNISILINEIITSFRIEFDRKGVELKSDIQENIIINGDKDKIAQILINLLSNGLKFTNSGDKVTVSVKEANNNVKIEVSDTGIGISKENLPYIFERFYRSDKSRNRKTGGAGIGLTIVNALVESHNGTITVDSIEGKGTKFTITLSK